MIDRIWLDLVSLVSHKASQPIFWSFIKLRSQYTKCSTEYSKWDIASVFIYMYVKYTKSWEMDWKYLKYSVQVHVFMCKEQIDSITYIEKQAEIRRKKIFKHMDTTPSYFERRSVAWTFADERSS